MIIATGAIFELLSPEIKELYNTIEKDFNLLSFAQKADGLL
jgi:hypothetical protein